MSAQYTIQDDSNESAPKSNRVEGIKKYLSDNLSRDLNAAAVAEKFEISISSLLHKFGMNSKLTFGKYVKELRMNRAMEMIKAGKWIQEIMDATGYKNRTTFYNAFKKTFQYSPRHFRE